MLQNINCYKNMHMRSNILYTLPYWNHMKPYPDQDRYLETIQIPVQGVFRQK